MRARCWARYWTPNGHGVRIDHAFASKTLAVLRADYVTQVGEHVLVGRRDAYSDHAALLVDVARVDGKAAVSEGGSRSTLSESEHPR
jgi:hypothetical protein